MKPLRRRFGARWTFLGTLALLVTVLPVLTTSPASAYDPDGCRWGGTHIVWRSATSYKPTQILQAANSWTNKTILNVEKTDSASGGVIIVTADNYGKTGWDALTTISACQGGYYLTSNPMIIRINRYYTDGMVPNKIQAIVAHEFGHAVGLQHFGNANTNCNSTANMAIMNGAGASYYFDTCHIFQPQPDDAQGIAAIY